MKQKIIGTGLSGLVGSRIVELLSSEFDFVDLSYDTGVDITKKDLIEEKFGQNNAEWVLHLAAKTDVDSCEKDADQKEKGPAWQINVVGTQNIVEAAKKFQKRVIYISTDFVFDGTKEIYIEEDTPNPVNWYGVTKYESEKLVMTNPQNLIVRITYPYRAKCSIKKDFVHAMLEKLSRNEEVLALTDHYFTPTFIDDITMGIKNLILQKASGIYHLTGSSYLTPYEAAEKICEVFGYDKSLIQSTTIDQYYQNRAKRPYKLRTKNDKIRRLGINPKNFLDGLLEIKKQGI